MTEAEWLVLNAGLMLLHIEERCTPSPRKLRLLATAYARFLETQPEYADSKHVAHLGEEVADGVRSLEELLNPDVRGWGYQGNWGISHIVLAPERIGNAIRRSLWLDARPVGSAYQEFSQLFCSALRSYILCIFGNPFRPVTFDPVWRTLDVVALARGIYDDRAFDRMPILADALQDAGCDNDDILTHCRDTGTPHARGCWVVDLVLGKG